MARLARLFAQGVPQHIVQRGNNRERIFHGDDDYHMFRQCMSLALAEHCLVVYAYVLMPDHFHLLATPATADSIPKALQSVGRRYVQYFNACHQRSGTLWEGRYRATVIDSERYFLPCVKYIELDPVRKGLVKDAESYPWSSCRANALGESDSLITMHPFYLRLGDTPERCAAAYRTLLAVELPEDDIRRIRDATNKGWALGDESFQAYLTQVTGRRAAPSRPGRPRTRGRAQER